MEGKVSQLSFSHYVKNLKLIERNREWWRADGVSSRVKASYYGHIAQSYLARKNRIKYLGSIMTYDNPATPLNLQNYPYEITRKVIANMHTRPKSVLDIGGNIGQFSLTINHALKGQVKIDVFEPNSYVYEFLRSNIESHENISAFNFGLGEKDSSAKIYFDPKRTGIGSLIKNNAGLSDDLRHEDIVITAHPETLTKRKKYDLVKIDVEGFEYHALAALKNIECKYLFMEISGQGRQKDYLHSEMFKRIKDQFGDFDIYYCGGLGQHADTTDMLLRFSNRKKSSK